MKLHKRWGTSDFSSIVGVGVAAQLLTVISGPLVARMLGPEGRGAQMLVMVMATMFARFGVASLSRAISHAVAQTNGSARDVLGPSFGLWLAWSMVPAVLAGTATAVVRPETGFVWVSVLEAGVIALLGCWLAILAGMLQGEGAVPRVNLNRLLFASTYVLAVTAIWFVHRTDLAVVILGTNILAQLVVLRVSWSGLRPATGDSSVRAQRSDIHRFARRTLVVSIGVADGLVDQLLVGLAVSSAALGLYAVASSVTTLPGMVLGGLAATLLPRMAAHSPVPAAAIMRRWLAGALGVSLLIVVGMQVVIAPALRILFGDEFVPAITCARILIVAQAVLAMRLVLSAAVQAQGRGARTSIIELITLGVMLAGVPIGVLLHGIEGAATAVLLAGLIACALLAASMSWRGKGVEQRFVSAG